MTEDHNSSAQKQLNNHEDNSTGPTESGRESAGPGSTVAKLKAYQDREEAM